MRICKVIYVYVLYVVASLALSFSFHSGQSQVRLSKACDGGFGGEEAKMHRRTIGRNTVLLFLTRSFRCTGLKYCKIIDMR